MAYVISYLQILLASPESFTVGPKPNNVNYYIL
jgi:hypothetical protein